MITTCPECGNLLTTHRCGDYKFNPPVGDPIIVYDTEWQSCVCGFHLLSRKLFNEIDRISELRKVLNPKQQSCLEAKLEEYLISEGNTGGITGLEISCIYESGRKDKYGRPEYRVFYSYEDDKDKIRTGDWYFSASFCDTKLQDVNFVA